MDMPPAKAHPAVPDPGAVRRRRRLSSSSSSTTPSAISAAASAAAGTAAGAARAAEHKAGRAARRLLLLTLDELPGWRRDNAYIASGYRPESGSYAGSAASLFYLHNESVNIWTHVAGSAASLALAAWLWSNVSERYRHASPADVLAFACFLAGAVVCLGMSATFHAVSNHSEHVAKWGNKLDYSGIVALIVGSYVPALYYGLSCEPALRTVYLYSIFLLGLGCGVVSWVEKFRTPEYIVYRTSMFVGLGVSGVVPICHAIAIYGYQALVDRMGLNLVLLQGFFYIAGAFLYAVRWPERSFPRTFDIWGNSHQIFHVFILVAAASHFMAMARAFDFHHSALGQCA